MPRPGQRRGSVAVHTVGFFVSVVLGAVGDVGHPRATRLAAAIYAFSVAGIFGGGGGGGPSALYHRVKWDLVESPPLDAAARPSIDLRRLIGRPHTAARMLVLNGTLATVILIVIWTGAAEASVLKLCGSDAPKWLIAVI